MTEWRPIETAPDDCDSYLVSDGETVWLAWRNDDEDSKNRPGTWMDATCPDHQDGRIYPTHWMPLPEPPA